MPGLIYKLACIAVSLVGLVAAFPMAAYAFVMATHNLSNGGWGILAITAAPAVLVALGVWRTALQLKLAAPSTFIAPTIVALIGIALTIVGIPFAQNASSYY